MAELERHAEPQKNALEIQDYLDEAFAADGLSDKPYIKALYNDATGLLAAISQGTIKTGQPRIVERLIQIVENYPNGKDPADFVDAIASCSERGLSAEGHPLSRLPARPMDR